MKNFVSIAKKLALYFIIAALLASCSVSFAGTAEDGESPNAADSARIEAVLEGYKGLNAVEANQYFKETVIPLKINSAEEGSYERAFWEAARSLKLKPRTKMPAEYKTTILYIRRLTNISDQLKPYAVEKYLKAMANEPAITRDVMDAALSANSGLYGMSRRIKNAGEDEQGTCRIADKIWLIIKNKKEHGEAISYEQAVDMLEDLLRYDVACPPFGFLDTYKTVLTRLFEKGYELTEVENTWESFTREKPYRGVNCTLKAPDGQLFEIQFHTPESYAVKRLNHAYYDELRKPEAEGTAMADILANIEYLTYSQMMEPKDIGSIRNIR